MMDACRGLVDLAVRTRPKINSICGAGSVKDAASMSIGGSGDPFSRDPKGSAFADREQPPAVSTVLLR